MEGVAGGRDGTKTFPARIVSRGLANIYGAPSSHVHTMARIGTRIGESLWLRTGPTVNDMVTRGVSGKHLPPTKRPMRLSASTIGGCGARLCFLQIRDIRPIIHLGLEDFIACTAIVRNSKAIMKMRCY